MSLHPIRLFASFADRAFFFICSHVRRLDAYLDRLPVLSDGASEDGGSDVADEDHGFAIADALSSPRLDELLHIVRSLSTASTSHGLLSANRIKGLLLQSGIPSTATPGSDLALEAFGKSAYETEIEWLLVGKATIQIYGLILNSLLDQIIPLSDDIWYWDDVLGSYTYSSLYTVQTSPIRLWAWSQDIYRDSKARLRSLSLRNTPTELVDSTRSGLAQQWSQFYAIVRDSIHERSFANIQRKVLSPVAYCRSEARHKQAQLRKLREITASGLGVLVDEGLHFGHDDDKPELEDQHDLKGVVERSVALMDVVLKEVNTLDVSIHEFEDRVFAGVEEDPELSVHLEDAATPDRPSVLARRLLRIIDRTLPEHFTAMQVLISESGRPSPVIRFWLPATVGLLSSTTILRILVNRKADIVQWLTEFGETVRDFWLNWVVEPVQKVIRTIRHDETSEIAIMSRDSLRADRESLERMVVDFAIDKPHFAVESPSLSETQIADIRNKVAEGDVTPVLRAYEKDLRSPFVGAIRGDLVRSLLIQVQKTKVDLEVAMTGIDSLLKSQELVFGFVGLTPGLFVSISALRYIGNIFYGKSGKRQSNKAGRAVRVLRNIDRILSEARPTENNVLSYKDHGLLLCELHMLRSFAKKLMPRIIEKEFLEDLEDLANGRGIQVQARALERIRWAYSRWLK
ncbi:ATP synthase regulation protein NCA2 [Paramyrothecium foliicola]|nr:ATP synthase regulation protein NCA2 [Paramyrothecium foliicola]